MCVATCCGHDDFILSGIENAQKKFLQQQQQQRLSAYVCVCDFQYRSRSRPLSIYEILIDCNVPMARLLWPKKISYSWQRYLADRRGFFLQHAQHNNIHSNQQAITYVWVYLLHLRAGTETDPWPIYIFIHILSFGSSSSSSTSVVVVH